MENTTNLEQLASDKLAELRKEYATFAAIEISQAERALVENLLFACGVVQDALNSSKKSDIDHANYFLSQV